MNDMFDYDGFEEEVIRTLFCSTKSLLSSPKPNARIRLFVCVKPIGNSLWYEVECDTVNVGYYETFRDALSRFNDYSK